MPSTICDVMVSMLVYVSLFTSLADVVSMCVRAGSNSQPLVQLHTHHSQTTGRGEGGDKGGGGRRGTRGA